LLPLALDSNRQRKPESRAFPKSGFHPDAAPVHPDNFSGNGEAETGSALCPGVGSVGLVEFFEDLLLIGLPMLSTSALKMAVSLRLKPSAVGKKK
jgi:hypothetical protein